MDEVTKMKKRLMRLRLLTESPKGVDFDFVKNYATRKLSRHRNYHKPKHEVHESKKHHLVEELALTSLFLSKCKGVLESKEIDLLQAYEMFPDNEVLSYVKSEWGEEWSKVELKKKVTQLKRKLGAHQEKLEVKKKPKAYPKPSLARALDTLYSSVYDKLLGKK